MFNFRKLNALIFSQYIKYRAKETQIKKIAIKTYENNVKYAA